MNVILNPPKAGEESGGGWSSGENPFPSRSFARFTLSGAEGLRMTWRTLHIGVAKTIPKALDYDTAILVQHLECSRGYQD